MASIGNTSGTLAVLREATQAWVALTDYPDVPHHWLRVLIEMGLRGGMIKLITADRLRPGMYLHDLNCDWMSHP